MRRILLTSFLCLLWLGGYSSTHRKTPTSSLSGTERARAGSGWFPRIGPHRYLGSELWLPFQAREARDPSRPHIRQFFHNSNTNYEYESDWDDWRIESLGTGGAYRHFEGMVLCDFEESCRKPDEFSGGLPFYDFCETRYLHFTNEMVVAVAGSDSFALAAESPRGLVLAEMQPPGWDGPYFFFVLEAPG